MLKGFKRHQRRDFFHHMKRQHSQEFFSTMQMHDETMNQLLHTQQQRKRFRSDDNIDIVREESYQFQLNEAIGALNQVPKKQVTFDKSIKVRLIPKLDHRDKKLVWWSSIDLMSFQKHIHEE
jgi:hypothetical protein